MKIQYRLDEKDAALILAYRARNLPSFQRSVRNSWRLGGGAVGLGLVMFLGCFFLIDDPQASAFWASWGFGLFLWGLFIFLWIWLATSALLAGRTRGLVKRSPELAGERVLELSGEGLTEYSEGRTMRVPWRRIEKLVIHKNFLYIYSEPMVTVAVPSRALADRGQGEEFLGRLTGAGGRPLERSVSWGKP